MLPEYNPDEEGADALGWCHAVDICLNDYSCHGSALVDELSKSLKGSASTWLRQVTYEDMSWQEFRYNFLARFENGGTCAATMISINNNRPKQDETHAAYANRLLTSLIPKLTHLTPEKIAASFVLAHISQFDSTVDRLARSTEMTPQYLLQELQGFSDLKRKLPPNLDENIDATPKKRLKDNKPVERPTRNTKTKKNATATVTSSEPSDVICYQCCEQGHSADNCPIQNVNALLGARPKLTNGNAIENRTDNMGIIHLDCSCCGPQPAKQTRPRGQSGNDTITATSPQPSTSSGTSNTRMFIEIVDNDRFTNITNTKNAGHAISSEPSSASVNNTIYIDLDTEDLNQNVEQIIKENGINYVNTLDENQNENVNYNKNQTNLNTIEIEHNYNIKQINGENEATDLHTVDDNHNEHQIKEQNKLNDVNTAVDKQNENETLQENKPTEVYAELILLEQRALVTNAEDIECGICMVNYPPGEAAVLRDCVHSFCKECLSGVVKHSQDATVSCPATGCSGLLQEREIRALVSPEEFERWLARGLAAAESGTRHAFHCRTRDCKGWALAEPGITRFPCPVCCVVNCITCQAVHEGDTCEEYRSKQKSDAKTKTYLDKLLALKKAMKCPECSAVITKQAGCDWIVCAACKTEICWATRGRRWGPGGRGDESGGCHCKGMKKRCHPSCKNCH